MLIYPTRRFALPLALALSLAVLAPLAGCSSGDNDSSDTAKADAQDGEASDPGSDIDVSKVVLPEVTAPKADVLEEREVRDEKRGEGEDEYIWRRISIRTFTDGSWEFNGPYREYYRDNSVQCDGQFTDNRRTGLWVWYYEDGTKSKESTYVEGVISGTATLWRPDGTLDRIESYTSGQKDGRWATYAEDGETMLTERFFKDGLPEGVATEWFPSGNKKQEVHFANGLLHGTRISWYDAEPGEKQQVELMQHFSQGKPNGRFVTYSTNGTQLLDLEYKDGERVQANAG